jgi:hypothetical protein
MSERLLIMAEYMAARQKPRRSDYELHYSSMLGEHYRIYPSGRIRYESGVIYDPLELARLRDTAPDVRTQIHDIKKLFKGATIL